MTTPVSSSEPELREQIIASLRKSVIHEEPYLNKGWSVTGVDDLIDLIITREGVLQNDLLFDLDEIDNKPWRVFRQLAKLMPEYADTYKRYESFYSHGGGKIVEKLIEKHLMELEEETL